MATGGPSSQATDGPVLSLTSKRLRALRKKHKRIIKMEESISQGKTLNKDQEETLRSKPYVVAAIDELERLKQPLSLPVSEEINAALKSRGGRDDKPNATTAEEQPNYCQSSSGDNVREGEVQVKEGGELDRRNERLAVVEDLLNLLYFGNIFDVKKQNDFSSLILTRTHERDFCLSYADDAASADMLRETDLDLISMLGGLLLSRPVDSSLSHKNAMQSCIEHARLWLSNSDQLIGPASDITYAGLREKLNKIMASDYFTATPEIRAPVEVSAAAGSYGSMLPVNIPGQVQVQGPFVQYEQSVESISGGDSSKKKKGTALVGFIWRNEIFMGVDTRGSENKEPIPNMRYRKSFYLGENDVCISIFGDGNTCERHVEEVTEEYDNRAAIGKKMYVNDVAEYLQRKDVAPKSGFLIGGVGLKGSQLVYVCRKEANEPVILGKSDCVSLGSGLEAAQMVLALQDLPEGERYVIETYYDAIELVRWALCHANNSDPCTGGDMHIFYNDGKGGGWNYAYGDDMQTLCTSMYPSPSRVKEMRGRN